MRAYNYGFIIIFSARLEQWFLTYYERDPNISNYST